MSENRIIRGLIVDDEKDKTERITEALLNCGGMVVATAVSAREVAMQVENGTVRPDRVDVAFIDSNLGYGRGGGLQVVGLLYREGMVRLPIGENATETEIVPDPHAIVTVGTSTELDWARELGSYSDVLGGPLVADWGWGSQPLDLRAVVDEVRRLKPLP